MQAYLSAATLAVLADTMTNNFNAALAEQKESTSQTVTNVVTTFERLTNQRRDSEERNYEVLKSLADDLPQQERPGGLVLLRG